MKIYGIGTDIANINRIKKSLKNKNFVNRLFDKNEIKNAIIKLIKQIVMLKDSQLKRHFQRLSELEFLKV